MISAPFFGVSRSAGSAKAREIMRFLRIVQLDPRWWLPSKLTDNTLVWMIDLAGLSNDVHGAKSRCILWLRS